MAERTQESLPTDQRSTSSIKTFLIADLRGYTSFGDQHGDEAAARVTQRFAQVATEVVSARAGVVVELRGDEVLAVFDSPREAVRAAVDLQSVVSPELDPELPLRAGVGLDAGEAVPVDGGYRGRALNMAARLCARAQPGEILVTPELAHLAGAVEGVVFEDSGPVHLKGFSRPVRLHVVVPVAASGVGNEPVATPSSLAFRVLGPFEATQGGRPVSLGGPQQRLLLAHLLLAANHVVSIGQLTEFLWEEEPPKNARTAIQSSVSHLRTALGPERIESMAPGTPCASRPTRWTSYGSSGSFAERTDTSRRIRRRPSPRSMRRSRCGSALPSAIWPRRRPSRARSHVSRSSTSRRSRVRSTRDSR